MKEMYKAMITILLIILYGIGLAAADPVMTVSQQPTDVEIGDTFTVDVTVDTMGAEIYAAQYDLSFDASILNATAQTPGDFLSLGGAETLVFKNTIDNTIGKMTYCETRAGDPESGAAESGVLASITFEVIGDGISDLTLSNMAYEYPNEPEPEPQESFLIYGYVSYKNDTPCNNLSVNITNLNTSEEWRTETSGNYYQITLATGIDLNASEILRFNVTDGMNFNVTDHAITTNEVNNGGLFDFNLTITSLKMGAVNGDGEITSADAVIILRMAVRGEYSDTADVSGDGSVTSLDALMIQQIVIDNTTL